MALPELLLSILIFAGSNFRFTRNTWKLEPYEKKGFTVFAYEKLLLKSLIKIHKEFFYLVFVDLANLYYLVL